MEASFKLGQFKGIVLGIHYTWLIVFGLLSYSLASGFFPSQFPGWSETAYWITGIIASLLLFVSVVAHEFGHSLVAISRGIPVTSITLFIFGGVATLSQESEEASDEFLIAIAGPAVSLVFALVSLGLWFLTADLSEPLAAIFQYLAFANFLLLAFNLIPGFPLDGGRVFRAIVWGVTNDLERATKIAATVGVMIGYGFIILGIFIVFGGETISGIWLVAIGWFLQSAAEQSYAQLAQRRTFSGVRVRSLMDPEPVVVAPDVSIDDLVGEYVLARNVRGLPVMEDGRLLGIITLTDIKDTPREQWTHLTVRDRMTPIEKLIVISPTSGLDIALQAMSEHDIHQIPVVDADRLVGLLTRGAVIRYVQLRQELGAPIESRRSESLMRR